MHHRYRQGDYETWKYIAPIQRGAWQHRTSVDGAHSAASFVCDRSNSPHKNAAMSASLLRVRPLDTLVFRSGRQGAVKRGIVPLSRGCVLAIATAVLMSPAAAQTEHQWKCTGDPNIAWDQQVVGCTHAIQSGKYSGARIAWAYYNRGNAYFGEGEYDRAIADYAQAIALDPKFKVAYFNRGDTYRLKGDYDRAIADFTHAIALDPKYAHAYRTRGIAYQAKKDYDRAIADYTQAIALDPKYAYAYIDCGIAYQAKGDNDRAIANYVKAIALDPKFALAYVNRGNAYAAKGDNDRAIADYVKAIALDPKFAIAYNNLGDANRAKGDNDPAIADYVKAIALDPKYVLAYLNRGNAYAAKGDTDRAVADYSQALVFDPKFAIAYNNRGDANRAKGDTDRAIADYSQAIVLDPKYALAYFSRGRLNLYSGALPKALADLNQASELNPKYAYTALWLDMVNKRSNLPSRLSEASKQIDMTKWPAPVFRLYLGQLTPEAVLAAADDPESSTKNDRVCEVNFYSGELALQRGAKDEATRLFRSAASGCPKRFIEYEGAVAELKALGVAQ
jgi:tetratricopeptide (TPR) repeat protein